MSKEIETTKEDGTIVKETVFTKDEYTAKEGELSKVNEELEGLRKIAAEKGENIKKLSQMSEEEKKTYDANTINLLRREEALSTEISSLQTKLTDKEKKENESAKNHSLTSIHHGDEATKKLLEEKYGLLTGMPETTPQEIAARSREAAKLAGIQVDPRNPLYTPMNGEAPNYKPKTEYTDTPEGKTAVAMARAALGLSEVK